MSRPALTYAQATKRRDDLYAEIEQLAYRALASYEWANNVLNNAGQAVLGPDGAALPAADRTALLGDYAVLGQVADLLRNKNPIGGGALGVDVMYAIRAAIVPGQNAE